MNESRIRAENTEDEPGIPESKEVIWKKKKKTTHNVGTMSKGHRSPLKEKWTQPE